VREIEFQVLDLVRDWSPIVISVVALAVTATFSWTGHADRRVASRLARERDLHSWVQALAELYVSLGTGDTTERKKACAKLALNIDYGRLMFPNERSSRALAEYPKGRRSSVLDPLVETQNRCSRGDWDAEKLGKDWREFTDQLSSRTTAFAVDTSPEAEGRKQYRNP
jgi:hypothetical protein